MWLGADGGRLTGGTGRPTSLTISCTRLFGLGSDAFASTPCDPLHPFSCSGYLPTTSRTTTRSGLASIIVLNSLKKNYVDAQPLQIAHPVQTSLLRRLHPPAALSFLRLAPTIDWTPIPTPRLPPLLPPLHDPAAPRVATHVMVLRPETLRPDLVPALVLA